MTTFTNPFQVANIYETSQKNLFSAQNQKTKKQYKSLNSLLKECPLLGMSKYGGPNFIA